MSNISHTPGPWRWWSQQKNTDRPQGYDLDKIINENGDCVLTIYGNQDERKNPDLQLIAAAPELLQQLERSTRALEWWKSHHILQWDSEDEEQLQNNKAAIAKAKGEA